MQKKTEDTDDEMEDVIVKKSKKSLRASLKEETLRGAISVFFVILALFFTLSSFDLAGVVGEKSYIIFKLLFGIGYFLLPLFFFALALAFVLDIKRHFGSIKIVASAAALLSSLGIVDIIFKDRGGALGHLISWPLLKLFAFYTSLLILFGILLVSVIVMFETEIKAEWITGWIVKSKKGRKTDFVEMTDKDLKIATTENKNKSDENGASQYTKNINDQPEIKNDKKKKLIQNEDDEFIVARQKTTLDESYVPLPLSILDEDRGKPGVGDIKANANIIKRTLQNFGIDVEMDEISIGPSVTRYALKPAEGVKLSRIVALQNDLALALAAHPIRIEAPIPGKSLVGIEIPNTTKTTVGLATLLSAPEFQESDKALLIALGKGVSGKSHFGNLAKMPHLLIAGATGSGKSVTIHTIITSLLYRNSPQNLKFIMIDPKRVELTLYNKIPHLLTPVITEAKKTILSLKWAAKEMDRRYDILETESVRDIESYHKNVLAPAIKKAATSGKAQDKEEQKLPETLPYIVIVIDELADIMQTYPRELESAIVRLAQMSRAVGIHLILSTQRPSVNVITGLIKANIPARIALQVSSQIDSRTILDTSGAEKLLGAGDMLFLSGEMSKPQRLQSAFISEGELKSVVKFLAENYETLMPDDITLTASQDKNSIFEANFENDSLDQDDDELYEQAREIVIEAGKASTSYIQRKLRVGYARAARLMDILEERGVIGPADGSKPRLVLGQESKDLQSENEQILNT